VDIRQIHTFLALYRHGNVTRAALELGLVQPAVSAQIAKLEKELGVQLFERNAKGVTPTAEGATLHGLLLPLSLELESVRQGMLDLSGRPRGTVRLGVVPSLSAGVVPGVLAAFCSAHPDVTVQLTEGYSTALLERVENGGLDVALVNAPLQPNGLAIDLLVSEELVVASAVGSTVIAPGPVSLDRLTAIDVIVPSRGQGLRVLLDRALARAALVMQPRLELDALTPTLELVRQGAWAALLPLIAVVREVEAGLFKINRLEQPIMRDLVVVHHPKRPLSLAARILVSRVSDAARDGVRRTQTLLDAAVQARSVQAESLQESVQARSVQRRVRRARRDAAVQLSTRQP
jgi:LysR family transcriptional regulator, nitrogen assimilation regulatory protein